MVSPFIILAAGLGAAFFLGMTGSRYKKFTASVVVLVMSIFNLVSIQWFVQFVLGGQSEMAIFTAGFKPPFAISLGIGRQEAFISMLVNLLGLMSSLVLWKKISGESQKLGSVLLVLFMGLNILILTRDLFNMFVFLEITAISLAGLTLLDNSSKSHSAGFKYLLASGLISSLYLLGAVLAYFNTGTLFLDDLKMFDWLSVPMGTAVVFLILISVVLELKPFPANGWALDLYQGAHPAVGAIVSGGIATTMLFLLHKLMLIATPAMYPVLVVSGVATFVFSNWMGMAQNNPQRLLGYSSTGQIGLIIAVLGLQPILGDQSIFIAAGILTTHFLAKSGLFWLAGIVKGETLESWAVLRNKNVLLILYGIFVFALSGFPPFPGFFAKWDLMMGLAENHHYIWIAAILTGSMFEAVYLFRWLGMVVKSPLSEKETNFNVGWNKYLPITFFGILLLAAGYWSTGFMKMPEYFNYIPLIAVVVLLFIDFLPVWVKNTLLLGAILMYSWLKIPQLENFAFIFGLIFSAGALLTLLFGYSVRGKRPGFYPLTAMMFAGLFLLVESNSLLSFFFAWEIMTAGSYFLILRGKESQPHALSYMLFSFGGALLILGGFALAHAETGLWTLDALQMNSAISPLVFIMLTIGFMTKTATIGLHIWLPGAHSEAESDVSPMVSGILLKAGVFGLIILFLNMGHQYIGGVDLMYIISWIAVITAIGGNLMAAFQEDMKRLLAYSSVGQLGYILFGLSLMSHLGWLLAISGSIMHFMYKTMLFQAVGGVYSRTHDRRMYRMGGLIYKMPLTFIVVLIGIIAMSGVPPLTGFSGKWLSFNAILQKEYYLQGAAMTVAGAIAFLYLFRLIHAPFLGQLKDHLRKVREANFWILLPQFLVVLSIMAFSTFPGLLLRRIGDMISTIFPDGALLWVNSALPFGSRTAISQYGYWNGTYVMIITILLFGVVFMLQYLMQRRNKKVKQFDIVYSAERPSTPETTHHAYNFYAHYQKAVGFLVYPLASLFWNKTSDLFHDIAHQLRQIYNGNGQTYLLHILLFFLFCFYLIYGGA